MPGDVSHRDYYPITNLFPKPSSPDPYRCSSIIRSAISRASGPSSCDPSGKSRNWFTKSSVEPHPRKKRILRRDNHGPMRRIRTFFGTVLCSF
jgi:hypothetical protein